MFKKINDGKIGQKVGEPLMVPASVKLKFKKRERERELIPASMRLIKPKNQLLASVYYKSYTFFVSSSNNYIVSINNQYQCFSTTDKNK